MPQSKDIRFSWVSLFLAGAVASSAVAAVACADDDNSAETGDEQDAKKKKKAGAGGVAGSGGSGQAGAGAGGVAQGGIGGSAGSAGGTPSGETCAVVDESGQGLNQAAILANSDPVAKLILQGAGACPKTFQEAQNRLRQTDTGNCTDTGADQAPAGVQTRLVSERSQVLNQADSYRAVVTRTCNGRKEFELFMSVFGIAGNPSKLPGNFEVIGFDPTTGAYNFYAREDGKWKFFGSSLSGIAKGYDCNVGVPGTCLLKTRSESRCWQCHPGGGLVMKELNSPWVHWEGDTTTPGAAELVDKFKTQLGKKSNGISLESTVADGNRTWNKKRVEVMKEKGSMADLLRPLFCTVEVNVQSATSSTGSSPSSLRADFFFDPAWSKFDSFSIDSADYKALLTSTGQTISDGAEALSKNGETIRDTVFAFSYPERSGADNDYVSKLKDAGIVDDDFVKDALVIDFTRPIFSAARCDLLQFAPTLDATKRDAASIRQGFIDKLKAAKPSASSAAGVFLANLQKTGDSSEHSAKLDAFSTACKARPKAELLADAFKIASLNRELARKLPVFEFPESLPVDSQNVPAGTFFDPATCKLTK